MQLATKIKDSEILYLWQGSIADTTLIMKTACMCHRKLAIEINKYYSLDKYMKLRNPTKLETLF